MYSLSRNEIVPVALAAGWHLGDAFLHMKVKNKKARSVWVGIGVGWSLFWLVKYFTKRKPLIETNA